ncbi:hypothetical protein [Streptomyces griseosporeus]|uniref:hypothetical protein n=1 Tax=Streptomyces griseosporeus TaxID=1910 RepID=UPI0036FC8C6E
MTWSRRIIEAVDRIPGEHSDRHERYRTWSMAPASADALLQTLLALSIHSLIVDAVANGQPGTPDMIGGIRLADISRAATDRPSHELLAGLPHMPEDDQQRINAVTLLIRDHASALALGRLSQMIRIMLMNLTAAVSAADPVCSDLVL